MTVFLQIVLIAGACYLGMFARSQLRRLLRRRERRRAWQQLDSPTARAAAETPGRAA